MKVEAFLQQQRFKRVLPYLAGDVLDFGGNQAELQPLVQGNYYLVNHDYTGIEKNKYYDSIVALAVIEHIYPDEVESIFVRFNQVLKPAGCLLITTPTPAAKPVLETLSLIGLLDRENIKEHKHYWNKEDLFKLAAMTQFTVATYKTFQFGFNQFVKFTRKNT